MAIEEDLDILKLDIAGLSKAYVEKQLSPLEVTRCLLDRIEKVNPKVNAFVTLLEEEAIASAVQAEKEIQSGHVKGPLHGIPIGLKDIIYTAGVRTTMGSSIYKDFIPNQDATVVEKLKEAGTILLGKVNTHEFAYGATGDRSYFGATRNPHNLMKVPGGSSSGSAAAVSSGLCYAALGTDTGGSIRHPSSFCGIVGMKPTFGRVSKQGVFPLSQTLDHVGPMTRTIRDNAIVLNALIGYDPKDPYSSKTETEDFTRRLEQGIKGTTIGIPRGYYYENAESEVIERVEEAMRVFQSLGAKIKDVDLPHMKEIAMAHQVTIRSEAYAVHERLVMEQPEEYDEEVRERLLTGKNITAVQYIQAQQTKLQGIEEFNRVLGDVDILLTPTLPLVAPDIIPSGFDESNTSVRWTINRFAGPTNLLGLPSLSIPCGFSSTGLPIGMQLIGRAFDEANVYRFGYAFEQEVSINTLKLFV
ncbi:amidase [Ammoniphilus resinae]|uniref:Aspartyl-tRNA(Asn)/glutamyl-tRNA(Gln) amidotransferase subunit A n=1 Tax=Ammoniphilus resinae TaxID=861532 RepID=A0ABS4GKY1_9BACL|nr:amidase [Ammoniphilus resinae]MBP1930917.1 aspartyl-tRNA(Asn)/glutamyl-tRNA(Gln) amidotransferase subunit A [Ammoniphilus resinae]